MIVAQGKRSVALGAKHKAGTRIPMAKKRTTPAPQHYDKALPHSKHPIKAGTICIFQFPFCKIVFPLPWRLRASAPLR